MELVKQKEDILKEIVNIGVGRAAGILNEMVDMEIELDAPVVLIESLNDFKSELKNTENIAVCKVSLLFHDSLEGISEIIISNESATKITSILTGEQIGSPDLDIAIEGTISELGNILLNGVMGSFSNMLDIELEYEVPVYGVEMLHEIYSELDMGDTSFVLVCKTKFSIDEINFDGQIVVIIKEDYMYKLDAFLLKVLR